MEYIKGVDSYSVIPGVFNEPLKDVSKNFQKHNYWLYISPSCYAKSKYLPSDQEFGMLTMSISDVTAHTVWTRNNSEFWKSKTFKEAQT